MDHSNKNSLIQLFKQAGQGHVFDYLDELDAMEQTQLLDQAASIDLKELESLIAEHVKGKQSEQTSLDGLLPAPYMALPENGGDSSQWETAYEAGAAAISAGRVAAFTVAGGQGTRLGYDGPKGTYPVTPVTKKTLFQVFANTNASQITSL